MVKEISTRTRKYTGFSVKSRQHRPSYKPSTGINAGRPNTGGKSNEDRKEPMESESTSASYDANKRMEPTEPSISTNSIMYGNVRGLINNGGLHKLETISDMAKNCFMLSFTESHLNKYISINESELPGWEQIRCDRSKRLGGGVVCYVRDTLPICNSLIHSNSYCELVCFFIPSLNLSNITIYHPPGCRTDKLKE